MACKKLLGGKVNYVYRFETRDQRFVAKVFKCGWPEEGKLPWIEQQLTKFSVPHAKLIHYSTRDPHFPHGFTISEYVEGQNALEAIVRGRLPIETYYSQISNLLRQIHQIPTAQYGYIGHGPGGMYRSFIEHKLTHEVWEPLQELKSSVENDTYRRIEAKVMRQLDTFEPRFTPALIHADPVPKNALWTIDQQLILIDWDEAIGGVWIADLAKLTYWQLYSNQLAGFGSTMDRLRKIFLRSYGFCEFGLPEILIIESALHLIYSVDLLAFWQRERNLEAFNKTKDLLMSLLEAN